MGKKIFIDVHVDSSLASGCLRKSTSGGIIMLGKHLIRGWSATQKVIALSSGEAEYYGMVRGGSEALGTKSLMADMGLDSGLVALFLDLNTHAKRRIKLAGTYGLSSPHI